MEAASLNYIDNANEEETINNKVKNYFTEEDDEFIIKNYKRMTAKQLSVELKMCESAVARRKRKLNLPSRAIWTDDEDNMLMQNADEYTIDELVEIIGHAKANIKKRAKELSVRIIESFDWSTQKQNEFEQLNDKKLTPKEIAEIMNYPVNVINRKLEELKYKYRKNRKWTKKEERFLKKNYAKMTAKEIGMVLHRTEAGVTRKRVLLKIKAKKSVKWTSKELDYLEQNWGLLDACEIGKRIGRSERAVTKKVCELKLGSATNSSSYLSVKDIAELFGKSRSSVVNWIKWGKLKTTERLGKKKIYFVTIEDLKSFMRDNLNLWTTYNMEVSVLGVEEDWLKEKRRIDYENRNMRTKSYWTTKEDAKFFELWEKGYSNLVIAKELNRTEQAIKRRKTYYKTGVYKKII